MKVIIRGRDTGKTRAILEECSKDPKSIIVCKHPERIADKCMAYGLPTVRAIGYEDLSNFQDLQPNDSEHDHFYIDELDEYVKHTIYDLCGYTLTKEDEE